MNAQYQAIGTQVIRWIKDEGVRPSDICILHMGEHSKRKLSSVVHRMLKEHGIELEMLKGATFDCNDQTVLATSSDPFPRMPSETLATHHAFILNKRP
jgi:predicted metal-dependent phosphotriesterase family hydrolase